MEIRHTNLAAELIGRTPALVALTGAGGKTTLLLRLAEAWARRGARVVATTTTRMHRPEETAWLTVNLAPSLDAALKAGVSGPGKALFAAAPAPDGGAKLGGFPPDAVDAAFRHYRPDLLLVEADGAAGRPLKAPARHEPVIPAETTVALALAGLGSLYQPFSEATVFRGEEFRLATGLQRGEEITPEIYGRLVGAGDMGFFKCVPAGAATWLFFNQADRLAALGRPESLPEIAARLRQGLEIGRGRLGEFFLGSLRQCGLECLACRI